MCLNKNVVLEFSVFFASEVMGMLLSSQINRLRHPRAYIALIYCRTLTCWHTRSGKHVD
jgi:hypothetical protein